MIRFENVTRIHQNGANRVRALGPVSFEIASGELVAIMGPSGSGKSTLLSLAGTLDQPTDGRIVLAGRDIATHTVAEKAALRRRIIGYVFQDLNLLPGLTALENVALPLELDGAGAETAHGEARQVLERLQLGNLLHRFPDDLSGGEQQRVAIARAFVGPRTLLLADEPTGALDTVTGEIVLRMLRKECDAGRTAILVTHNAAHAAWADRVLYLRDGLSVESPGSSASSPPPISFDSGARSR